MVFNFIADAIGGIGSLIGANEQSDAITDAARIGADSARLGFDFLQDDENFGAFLPGGANAFRTRQALLGLGGDEAAAQQAFDNYLDSTGFQFALNTGRDAITGSRAARGLLDSGATAESLTEFGNQLGRQAFNNYLGQLTTDANFGLQAGTAIGSAGSSAGAQTAAIQANAGSQLADVQGNMFNAIGESAGSILGRRADTGRWFG
jgi:hypothetical protein